VQNYQDEYNELCWYGASQVSFGGKMNVKEILIEWLKDHGCDGLCNTDIGCGCGFTSCIPGDTYSNDFIPCEDINENECQPAYRWECEKCMEKSECLWYDEGKTDGCWKTTKQRAG